jgi:type I restriction enzyme, S subunit
MMKNLSQWAEPSIGELCDLLNGRAFKPTEWSRTGLPIIRIQNLNNSNAAFNFYDGVISDRVAIKSGDLLFAWSGTPGTSFGAHIWKGAAACLNQHIFKVVFNEDLLDKEYFRLAINQQLNHLIEKAHGGVGLRHVTKSKFEETKIPLAPLNEQQRIVSKIEELFSELDAGIASLKTARAQLKIYRQALLKHAFEGKLTESWRKTHADQLEPADQLLTRIAKEREAHY